MRGGGGGGDMVLTRSFSKGTGVADDAQLTQVLLDLGPDWRDGQGVGQLSDNYHSVGVRKVERASRNRSDRSFDCGIDCQVAVVTAPGSAPGSTPFRPSR